MTESITENRTATLRRLSVADYDAIMDLWGRAGLHIRPQGRDSREAFAQQAALGVQTIIGLEQDGQLIGVVIATHDGRKGWINRLAVDPEHRRQGHAMRLIAEAERVLHEQGMRIIAALVESWNEASLNLLQKAGYSTYEGGVIYLSKRDSWDV